MGVEGLSLGFGRVQALMDVSFDVAPGEILALIGPNGAGKTSILNCISGFYRPQGGRIHYLGRDITDLLGHLPSLLRDGKRSSWTVPLRGLRRTRT